MTFKEERFVPRLLRREGRRSAVKENSVKTTAEGRRLGAQLGRKKGEPHRGEVYYMIGGSVCSDLTEACG